jgi:hypothetical protein
LNATGKPYIIAAFFLTINPRSLSLTIIHDPVIILALANNLRVFVFVNNVIHILFLLNLKVTQNTSINLQWDSNHLISEYTTMAILKLIGPPASI